MHGLKNFAKVCKNMRISNYESVIARERNFRDLKVPNSGLIRSGLWFFVKKSVFCQ